MILRANLQRTGVYATEPVTSLHGIKWQFDTGSQNAHPCIIADDWLYVSATNEGGHGFILALDTQTGIERWRTPAQYGRCSHIVGNTMYCANYQAAVAIDRFTGQIRNAWPMQYGVWAPPTVINSTMYYGGLSGFFAIDLQGDAQRWRCSTRGFGPTPPAFDGRNLYFGTYGRSIYAVHADTGRKHWLFKASERINQTTALYANYLYAVSEHGNVHALDAQHGHEVWEYPVGEVITAPAVSEELVCFGIWDGRVVALDWKSGMLRWTFKTRYAVPSAVSIAGDVAFVGSGNFRVTGGQLDALELQTGKLLWSFETRGWAQEPVPSNQVVFVGCAQGMIYALA